MLLAAQLINDNGISVTALGFFTALLGAVTGILKLVLDDRKERRKEANEQRDKLNEALVQAKTAATNTEAVGDGFASGVLAELRRLSNQVADLSVVQQRHLIWHQENETRKGV